jgi:hypothetical protein
MKTKSLFPAVLTLTLSLTTFSSMAAIPRNLLGDPSSATTADRSIKITPDTRYVNVQGGQTVKFNDGGKTFTWVFDGPVGLIDLNQVAPPGLLDHKVTAFVSPNPMFMGQ